MRIRLNVPVILNDWATEFGLESAADARKDAVDHLTEQASAAIEDYLRRIGLWVLDE